MTDDFPLLQGAPLRCRFYYNIVIYCTTIFSCPSDTPAGRLSQKLYCRRQSRSSALTRASPPGNPVKAVVDYSPCCLFVRIRFLPSTILFIAVVGLFTRMLVFCGLVVGTSIGSIALSLDPTSPYSPHPTSDEPALAVRLRGNKDSRLDYYVQE
jgi:hypothetical protein